MSKNKFIETYTVEGIPFEHGTNDQFEYYSYQQSKRVNWQIWRHLKADPQSEMGRTWFACLTRNGGSRMLNTCVGDGQGGYKQKDPLFDINAFNHSALLVGLVGLIKKGEWPQDIIAVQEDAP